MRTFLILLFLNSYLFTVAQTQLTHVGAGELRMRNAKSLAYAQRSPDAQGFLIDNKGHMEVWEYTSELGMRKLARLFSIPEGQYRLWPKVQFSILEGKYFVWVEGYHFSSSDLVYIIGHNGTVTRILDVDFGDDFIIVGEEILDIGGSRGEGYTVLRWKGGFASRDTLMKPDGSFFSGHLGLSGVNDSLGYFDFTTSEGQARGYLYNSFMNELTELFYNNAAVKATAWYTSENGVFFLGWFINPQTSEKEFALFEWIESNELKKLPTVEKASWGMVVSNFHRTTLLSQSILRGTFQVFTKKASSSSYAEVGSHNENSWIEATLISNNLVFYTTSTREFYLLNVNTGDEFKIKGSEYIGSSQSWSGQKTYYFFDGVNSTLYSTDGTPKGTKELKTFRENVSLLEGGACGDKFWLMARTSNSQKFNYFWVNDDVVSEIPMGTDSYNLSSLSNSLLAWASVVSVSDERIEPDSTFISFEEFGCGNSVARRKLHLLTTKRYPIGIDPYKVEAERRSAYYVSERGIFNTQGTARFTRQVDHESVADYYSILKRHRDEFYKVDVAKSFFQEKILALSENGAKTKTLSVVTDKMLYTQDMQFQDYITHCATASGVYTTIRSGSLESVDLLGNAHLLDNDGNNCVYHASDDKVFYHNTSYGEVRVFDEISESWKTTLSGWKHLVHLSNCFPNEDSVLVFMKNNESGDYSLVLQTPKDITQIESSGNISCPIVRENQILEQIALRLGDYVYFVGEEIGVRSLYQVHLPSLTLKIFGSKERLVNFLGTYRRDSFALAIGKWKGGKVPVYEIGEMGQIRKVADVEDAEMRNYDVWASALTRSIGTAVDHHFLLPLYNEDTGQEIGDIDGKRNLVDVYLDVEYGAASSLADKLSVVYPYLCFSGKDDGGVGQLYSFNLEHPFAKVKMDGTCLDGDVRFSSEPKFLLGGTISRTYWDLGDGTIKDGNDVGHTYSAAGRYTIVHHVVDKEGIVYRDTFFWNAGNHKFSLIGPSTVRKGREYRYKVSDSTEKYDFYVGKGGTIADYGDTWVDVIWHDSLMRNLKLWAVLNHSECSSSDTFQVMLNGASNMFSESLDVQVYPNPIGDRFMINSPVHQLVGVRIYSLRGALLDHRRTSGNLSEMDSGDIPPGVYLLKVETSAGFVWKRVVK